MTASSTAFVPVPVDAPPAAANLDPVPAPRPRAVPSRRRSQVVDVLLLGGLLIASIMLRLEGAGMWLWIDEALTIGLAQEPLTEIPSVLRLDGSPPLYYLALHLWMQVFGSGEVATHALSLVFATLCVPAAYWAGRSLFDRRTAYMAAVLAATSPFLTHFARETRMYSLVTLLALLVTTTFLQAFVRNRRRAVPAFAVALVALLYTHNWGIYLAAATVVALVPAVLAAPRPRARLPPGRARPRRGGARLCPVALRAPRPDRFHGRTVVVHPGPSPGGPRGRCPRQGRAGLVRARRRRRRGSARALWRRPRTADGATAWVLACLVIVPIVLGWAVAHVEPSWATRYLAVVVGPLLLLAAWGLARAGTTGVIALVLAVVLWVQPLTRLERNVTLNPEGKSDAKALAASIDRRLGEGDLVIVAQPEAVPLFAHYVETDVRFATLWGEVDRPMIMDWRSGGARLAASNVDDHLSPLVADLEPGARIALVGPGGEIVDTDTDWIRTFHRRHAVWRRTLTVGPSTVLVERIKSAQQDRLDELGEGLKATPEIEAGPGPGSEHNVPVAVPFTVDVYEVVASRSNERP